MFIAHVTFFFQRQVLSALSQIAKHSVDLAEMVVEAEIFPAVLTSLNDPDEYVKKNVAIYLMIHYSNGSFIDTDSLTTFSLNFFSKQKLDCDPERVYLVFTLCML